MAASPATATATPGAAANAAPAGGKKKLLVIIGAGVLVLLLVAGGLAAFLMKSKAPAEDEGEEAPAAAARHAPAKHDAKKSPPAFLPLDPFTVNLADKDGERFAQIAVTLELDDAHFDEQIKAYLPAIRNNILMVLAQKTAAELLTREGKELLARQIIREALRPMGIEVEDEDTPEDEHAAPKKKTKKKAKAPASYPIKSVQFASFIIQ